MSAGSASRGENPAFVWSVISLKNGRYVMDKAALLVDDHALTKTLLHSSLVSFGFQVTAVSNAEKAVDCFHNVDPDLLLTDVDLGSRPNGAELATLLHTRSPGLAVVLMSNYPDLIQVPGYRSLPPGTRFISKLDVDDVSVLRDVIEAALRERHTDQLSVSTSTQSLMGKLTNVQLDVLRMVAEGWSNQEIAHQRGTNVGSIEKILTRIFRGLGLEDNTTINQRVAAAREYIRAFGPPTPSNP